MERLLLTLGIWATRFTRCMFSPFGWVENTAANAYIQLWNARVDLDAGSGRGHRNKRWRTTMPEIQIKLPPGATGEIRLPPGQYVASETLSLGQVKLVGAETVLRPTDQVEEVKS